MSTPCSTAGGSALGSSGCCGVAPAAALKEAAAKTVTTVALILLMPPHARSRVNGVGTALPTDWLKLLLQSAMRGMGR